MNSRTKISDKMIRSCEDKAKLQLLHMKAFHFILFHINLLLSLSSSN